MTITTQRCPESGQSPSHGQFAARFSLGIQRAVTCGCGARVYVHPRRMDWSSHRHVSMGEHNLGVDSNRTVVGRG